MTKNERKGLLIGIGMFAFLIANYINELIREPMAAFFLVIMLIGLIISFVIGTLTEPNKTYHKPVPKIMPIKREYDIKKARIRKVKRQKIETLRRMDPYQFEEYVRDLLLLSGFKSAQCTSRSNDGGKDIVAIDESGKCVFVECKRHDENNHIGRPLIQKFHSALIDGKADYGLFVTTSYFNKNAVKYASDKQIKLIDARRLADMIESIELLGQKTEKI